jgi:hypothetical protein
MTPVPGSKVWMVRMLRCLLHGALSGLIAWWQRSSARVGDEKRSYLLYATRRRSVLFGSMCNKILMCARLSLSLGSFLSDYCALLHCHAPFYLFVVVFKLCCCCWSAVARFVSRALAYSMEATPVATARPVFSPPPHLFFRCLTVNSKAGTSL